MASSQVASPWLTIEQLADRWQTTVAAVYKLRNRGSTPKAIKVGKSLRFHVDDVTAWERERREASA